MDDELRARLARIEGVTESPSTFSSSDAWWCNGKEIAHFDADDVIDVRLTRAVIREMRGDLRSDSRVELRKNVSDWIEVRLSSDDDVAFVVRLVGRAVAAHRAAPGEMPKSPPSGADLERRRRFH